MVAEVIPIPHTQSDYVHRMVYRIYPIKLDLELAFEETALCFHTFHIYQVKACVHSVEEPSLIVELIADEAEERLVNVLARIFKRLSKRPFMFITRQPVTWTCV